MKTVRADEHPPKGRSRWRAACWYEGRASSIELVVIALIMLFLLTAVAELTHFLLELD